MPLSRKKFWVVFVPLGLIVLLLLLALAHPRTRTALRMRSGFLPLEQEVRVFYQPGAEEYARQIADALPAAIARVELFHSLPFVSDFRVYVCASHENFTRYINQPVDDPVRGIAFPRDIWVSPKAFAFYGRDTHRQTLAHELSHLHLGQHLPWWHRVKTIPTWFSEGLADLIADTGDERISREEAIEGFFTGLHLVPDEAGRVPFPKGAQDYGLTWPMFHLQSRMFIEYLYGRDEESFKRFIREILGGARFGITFKDHFGDSLDNVWHEFLESFQIQSKDTS